jgi:hypothetical protein
VQQDQAVLSQNIGHDIYMNNSKKINLRYDIKWLYAGSVNCVGVIGTLPAFSYYFDFRFSLDSCATSNGEPHSNEPKEL